MSSRRQKPKRFSLQQALSAYYKRLTQFFSRDPDNYDIYCCRKAYVYLRFMVTSDWVVINFIHYHRKIERDLIRAKRDEMIRILMWIPKSIAILVLCLVPYIGLIINLLLED